tara:strand:+ start:143 stop:1105 length:963 start_codon:yes stop_codon:yes gene_type:complete
MKVFQTTFSQEDSSEILDVIQDGNLGFGTNVGVLESKFKLFSNKEYNIATNSASASAFMIFSYLKEKYGICDVYTTSLGFTSPSWAANHFGHNLIFVDVNENLLFDCEDYKKRRNTNSSHKKDRKIVLMPVLYGGVSHINNWDILGDEIVVVDSAHCVTPTIECDFLFFSFHPYKPICSSDGGMISTDDVESTEYFKNYRNFGRSNIENSYDITQEGFKFYMNNLNASIALVSIKKYYLKLSERRKNFLQLTDTLPHDEYSSYYFATRIDDDADKFNKLNKLSRHYPLLHKTKFFKKNYTLPVSEELHPKIINLPLWKLL